MPTVGVQGDVVQAKHGSHGDYEIIALCPSSPQEMFNYTVTAFNYAEKYRTPVFILADAFVGHMREEVIVPEAETIEQVYRKLPEKGADSQTIKGFLDEDVAPMPIFGRGYKAHVTGSCHDEAGKRNLIDVSSLDLFVRRLSNKILKHKEEITIVERNYRDGDVVLVSYGPVARAAAAGAELSREDGIPAGTLRLATIWPFPDHEIERMARRAKHVIVLENNLGQMYPYIKAAAASFVDVSFLAPKLVGQIQDPEDILTRIREVVQ
jgi:2-oxoglutarate ferredoxin oxidoreductase subunit alpha